MMQGPNIEATKALAESINIPVIASGGLSTLDDIHLLMAIESSGVTSVVFTGEPIYSGAIDLREAVKLTKKAAKEPMAKGGAKGGWYFAPPASCPGPWPISGFEHARKTHYSCLDVKDGRVVKGVQFLTACGDPVEAAEAYDAQGADELTFLDITASDRRGIILDVVRRTTERVFIPLTVGGGPSRADLLAEREGFEPSIRFTVYTLSRRAP